MPQWGERHKRSNLHNRISTQLTFTWPDQKDKGKDKDILKEIQRERICIVDNPRRVAKWSDCLFCASPASELPSVFFCQQYLSAIRLQSLNRQSPIYQLQFKKARLHLQLQIWSRALLPWEMSFQIWRPLKIFHNNNVFQWWSKDRMYTRYNLVVFHGIKGRFSSIHRLRSYLHPCKVVFLYAVLMRLC